MTWLEIGAKAVELDPPRLVLTGDAAAHGAANGRVSARLDRPRTRGRVHALTPIPAPTHLLTTPGFLVAVGAPEADGRQSLEIRDAEGGSPRPITGRRSRWVIDPRGPTLLGTSIEGAPTAWSLRDPDARPVVWSTRLDGRVLEAIRVVGSHVLTAALEERSLGGPLPNVVVQLLHVPDFGHVSKWQTLRGAKRIAERIAENTPRVAVGVETNGPILATLDAIYWADWHLRPRGEATVTGVPMMLSPRSDGRSWSVWLTAEGPVLRRLVPGAVDHEQVVHEAFMDTRGLLVGPDNGVTLVCRERIQQFDANGQLRFKFNFDSCGHAFVDASGTTLFAQESTLLAASPTGQCTEVWAAPPGAGKIAALGVSGDRVWVVLDGELVALD